MKPTPEGARPRPQVCRRLFADDPEDPLEEGLRDNLFNQMKDEINQKLDEACKKYNFDFRSEVPMEGSWVWERIDREEAQPPVAAPGPGQPLEGRDSPEVEDPSETPTPSPPQDVSVDHSTVPQ